MSEQAIEDSITIGAPRAEVFAALTDARRLEHWMATEAESEPRSGGRFRYSFEFDDTSQNNEQAGEYAEVAPDRLVAVPWVFPFSPKQTKVEFRLEDAAGGTRVAFRHSGFEQGGPWEQARESFGGGWRLFLEGLKTHVEQGVDARPFGMKGKPEAG